MDAIHSVWTKPMRCKGGEFFAEDFDILTTILSALKWREKNGSITLVTDFEGLEYYRMRGMLPIWDGVSTALDGIPDSINPQVFWAAGKLFALGGASVPAAIMDTDFIVWDRLAFSGMGDIAVIHREDISPEIYPDRSAFKMKDGYVFSPETDWSVKPSNTAFYVIQNDRLRREYVRASVGFMEHAIGDDRLIYMVFAEQRMLSVTAARLGIAIKELSTLDRLFADGERCFTHIWGMKEQMRRDKARRGEFCCRAIKRICADFPEYIPMLGGIPELAEYGDFFSVNS